MASKSLILNLNSNKANILNLNDKPFSKKSIYYNYYGKNEFTEGNILSSTGIYTNARSMELVKDQGDHAPREWVII